MKCTEKSVVLHMDKLSLIKKRIVVFCAVVSGLIVTGIGIMIVLPSIWIYTVAPVFGLFHSSDTELFVFDDFRTDGVFQEEEYQNANALFNQKVMQVCPIGTEFTSCGRYFSDLSDWVYVENDMGGGTYHFTHKIFGGLFWMKINSWRIRVWVDEKNIITRPYGVLVLDSVFI